MKPYFNIPENFDPQDYPEAAVPEEIFLFLKEKGWAANFYFITGHISPHDQRVLDRTGAQCLKKTDDSIQSALERIAAGSTR